jgi:hypothetical protein
VKEATDLLGWNSSTGFGVPHSLVNGFEGVLVFVSEKRRAMAPALPKS